MSSAPDSNKLPYEISAEEIKLLVSPIVGANNEAPESHKWVHRWILTNSKLITYDGIGSFLLCGFKPPFSAQVEVRKTISADLGGMMPAFLGDFEIRGTSFMVTKVPEGAPCAQGGRLPEMAMGLIKLDEAFRKEWGERPYPHGMTSSDMDFISLNAVAKRLPMLADRIKCVIDGFTAWPFNRLLEYPLGIIHGDPGIDNCFIDGDSITFSGGPNEIGPELVDIAYFLQSAAVYLEDFNIESFVECLARHYKKSPEIIHEDLILADAIAHVTVVQLFESISAELAPDFAELYDHLIGERLTALETLVASGVFG